MKHFPRPRTGCAEISAMHLTVTLNILSLFVCVDFFFGSITPDQAFNTMTSTTASVRTAASTDTPTNKNNQKGFRYAILPDTYKLGENSAIFVADTIKKIVAEKGYAHVIFATGASQFHFINYLVSISGIPWEKVTAYHLDEYVGLIGGEEHGASFRKYLKERLFSKLKPQPRQVNYVNPDKYEEYEKILAAVEIDLACIGIGENGHIAFNDPPVADFNDPKLVKVVELDEKCRQQQAGEGWFNSLAEVPKTAITLTVPAIMRAKIISCVVPDERKAVAVHDTLNNDISTNCPATILRNHGDCIMWLDKPSASKLSNEMVENNTM
jgi:glucosamine-6-phosphate deaminase